MTRDLEDIEMTLLELVANCELFAMQAAQQGPDEVKAVEHLIGHVHSKATGAAMKRIKKHLRRLKALQVYEPLDPIYCKDDEPELLPE